MASLMSKDVHTEIELYNSSQFDSVDFTSGHESLMRKYFGLPDGESLPIMGEYFGVALAFAALGALIRDANVTGVKEGVKDDPLLPPKTALQAMLKGAMERLHYLAQKAQDLQNRLTGWDEEKAVMLQKLAIADEELKELSIRRLEDAKANEKVVRIYADREQGWQSEKNKLRHEIDMLRKDLINQEASGFCSPGVSPIKMRCDVCEVMKKRLRDQENRLKEKEFLALTTMEDARIKEQEIRELTSKLLASKTSVDDVTEKLKKELQNSADREVVLNEVRDMHHDTELRLAEVVKELDFTKSDLQALSLTMEDHSVMSLNLINQMSTLRQESEDKEFVLSTMLQRNNVERKEKEGLARKLSSAQPGTEFAETGKYRRLTEERTRRNLFVEIPDECCFDQRGYQSLRNQYELEKVADLERFHSEDVNSIRATSLRKDPALMKPEQSSDIAFKSWLEVVKGRLSTRLEEKLWSQIETFDRQHQVKDEKSPACKLDLNTSWSELYPLQKVDQGCCSPTALAGFPTGEKIMKDAPGALEWPKLVDCVRCGRIANTYQRSMDKLQIELQSVKEKFQEQDAEHAATIQKMAENIEAELQHKDVQLAVLEAKLCQVQLQLEEAEFANVMSSSDECEEKVFLENIDKTPPTQLAETLRFNHAQTDLKAEVNTPEHNYKGISYEESIQKDSVSDSAKLLTRLKDMCLKESKPPAMVQFLKNLEIGDSDDLVFTSDDCWLIAEPIAFTKPLQPLPAKELPVPERVPHVCEGKNVVVANNPLRSEKQINMKTPATHKKGKKGVNKQPLSPKTCAYHPVVHEVDLTKSPSKSRKSSKPVRFNTFDFLKSRKPQRTLFTEPEALDTRTLQESRGMMPVDGRKSTHTREDTLVLKLAPGMGPVGLKPFKINNLVGDVDASGTRPGRRNKSPVERIGDKQIKRNVGLAGKFSQLAHQIGLTKPIRKAAVTPPIEVVKEYIQSPKLDLCLRKNPLFSQGSSAFKLVSHHQKSELVCENTDAIKVKPGKENGPDCISTVGCKTSLFTRGNLVNSVRTHLSHVPGVLRNSKPTKTITAPRPLTTPVLNPRTASRTSSLRKCSLLTNPSTPRKQLTLERVTSPSKNSIAFELLTPSPKSTLLCELLTPSPKSVSNPRKLIQKCSSNEPSSRSFSKPTLMRTKTTMKDDYNTGSCGWREAQPLLCDPQPRQWTQLTSNRESLRMGKVHLR